jgi:hypothetical protein
MVQPIPYLTFDGTCAEAMRFTRKSCTAHSAS